MQFVAVFLGFAFLSYFSAVFYVVCAWLVDLKISKVSIGVGPTFGIWNVYGTPVEIKPVPLESAIQFRDPVFGDDYKDFNPVFRLPVGQCLFMILTTPVLMLTIGIVTYLLSAGLIPKIAALVVVIASSISLLPLPAQSGLGAILRVITPETRLPYIIHPPDWISIAFILFLYCVWLLMIIGLGLHGDAVVAWVDQFVQKLISELSF